MITLCIILSTNIVKTLANNKEGKTLTDFHGNLISINFIIPGGGRHGVYLTNKSREILDIRLGLIILYNFALDKAAPR